METEGRGPGPAAPDPEESRLRTEPAERASLTGASPDRVRVAVGVVLRRSRVGGVWVLVGRRFSDTHLPDLWEFPGGKIAEGETGAACARREIEEETGVRAEPEGLILERPYDYADQRVWVEFHRCRYRDGILQPLGCRAARWVRLENLDCYRFPDANGPILARLALGKL